ncbi:hypothetical protein L484_008795 [Morus notabilis]|uniref:Membrin-11 n=1 Tax=Morus notabilis TaxID=981085 RepID=W9S8Z0_9ROSA|nr:hypothetical protein L484_008795 [Morus notabilis]
MAVEMGGGGGGTLSEKYQSSKKLLLRSRDGLERLERLEYSSTSASIDSPDLSFSVKKDISQIHSICAEMERLWRSVPAKSQRDLWKRKVEQVAEEAESLKQSLDKYFLRNQRRMMEAKEKAELLGRANGESAHVLRIFDEEAQAMQSVRNSSRLLEEASATGEAILFKYSEQRERLKGEKGLKSWGFENQSHQSSPVVKCSELYELRRRATMKGRRPDLKSRETDEDWSYLSRFGAETFRSEKNQPLADAN